jgi:hypothetical protein
MQAIVAAAHPMTVRGVFYQMVKLGAVTKTENECKRTVNRLLTKMRLAGELPFDWIADNTRWMRKPRTHGSMETALAEVARTYRRALWDGQDAYVEVWCEKDALAGVLYEVTDPFDVPLMVTRGGCSLSFLYEAAQAIRAQRRPAYLYYLGDYDNSGILIPRAVERRLRAFAPNAIIHFERLAVNQEQINEWSLPTRPSKVRSRHFTSSESVELDAVSAPILRSLVEAAIRRHLDDAALDRTKRIEAEERATLLALSSQYPMDPAA